MRSKAFFFKKAVSTFLVYFPTMLIFLLMSAVYFSYVYVITKKLITPNDLNLTITFIGDSSGHESSRLKGYYLIASVSFFFGLCLFSLLRVILMDPGYLPDPLSIEYQIVTNKGPNFNRRKVEDFFLNFGKMASESPLTSGECREIFKTVHSIFDQSPRKNINDNSGGPISLYEKYINIDITKLPLCNTCLRLKMERSHHCRQCGRCVKKMDHHCPWLASCIGFRNYKYFLLSHLYGLIGSSIVFITLFESLINYAIDRTTTLYMLISVLFAWTCNAGLLCFLIWLFMVNWRLMLKGESVIESLDKERFPSVHMANIYDLGTYRNFTLVFGKSPLVWFIPFFANYEGEGVKFETSIG